MHIVQHRCHLKSYPKRFIAAILGASLFSFCAPLFSQNLASGTSDALTVMQKENPKSSTPPVKAPAPKVGKSNHGYGTKFCMFASVNPKFFYYELTTFSSLRLGECVEEEYLKLSEASIMAQLQTTLNPKRIIKLGFHTNVASANLTAMEKPYFYVGVSSFDQEGVIKLNYLTYIQLFLTYENFRKGISKAAYVPMVKDAPLHYIYSPGLTVYELVSPDGRVFIMTSFTNQFNSTLSLENLRELGASLNMPPGWKFRSRVLERQVNIEAAAPSYQTTVIFDDFQNFYIEINQ
jgi:hypothetical protein